MAVRAALLLKWVIRRERRRRRRTMEWLAERAAISLVYLGEIERGKKYPSAPIVERPTWALGLEISVMLELVAAELRAGEARGLVHAVGKPESLKVEARSMDPGARGHRLVA